MYKLLDQCDDYLVVHKFPNVSIHNESAQGLIQQLREDFRCEAIVPVHRLDKATTGLLLCAKNQKINQYLAEQFQQRRIEKHYLALIDKKLKKKQRLVFGDMLKTRGRSWRLAQTRKTPAITQFFSYGVGDGRRLSLLKPYTDKTHQLRVMMKNLGVPTIGGDRYDPSDAHSHALCLHAYSLAFNFNGRLLRYCEQAMNPCFDLNVQALITKQCEKPYVLAWPALSKNYGNQ